MDDFEWLSQLLVEYNVLIVLFYEQTNCETFKVEYYVYSYNSELKNFSSFVGGFASHDKCKYSRVSHVRNHFIGCSLLF